MGTRKRLEAGQLGGYEWITYQTAWKRASALGAGLLAQGLMKQGDFLGVSSVNRLERKRWMGEEGSDEMLTTCLLFAVCNVREEWILADLAAIMYGWVTVPLVVTLGEICSSLDSPGTHDGVCLCDGVSVMVCVCVMVSV